MTANIRNETLTNAVRNSFTYIASSLLNYGQLELGLVDVLLPQHQRQTVFRLSAVLHFGFDYTQRHASS